MQIKTLITYLEKLYPLQDQEEWDFSGYAHGMHFNELSLLKGVLLALDITSKVIQKAISEGLNLIITHHPFIFNEEIKEDFQENPYKARLTKEIFKHKLVLYSLHTNFDKSFQGTSFLALKKLFKDFLPHKIGTYGAQIEGNFNLKNVISKLKEASFEVEYLSKLSLPENFKKIQLYAGSGDVLEILDNYQSDSLVITSDIKWNERIFLWEEKIPVLQISHQIEEVVLRKYQKVIKTFDKNIKLDTFFIKKTEKTIF